MNSPHPADVPADPPAGDPPCVVVLLTFNSAGIIRETAAAALRVSPHVYAVDSGSTDGTDRILLEMGCTVAQHPFSNYSDQRNWAIAQVEDRYRWQLHLDADEVLDDQAVREIRALLDGAATHDAYMLRRRDYFMGRMLRFSGVNPWHLRLFRSGVGRCEARLYDQHFIAPAAQGRVGRLAGYMHDKNAQSLSNWVTSHNRWSDAEAREKSQPAQAPGADVLQPRLLGDARERTRFIKQIYYRLPIGVRAFAYFIYRYLLRGGFLDGRPGFYFAFFQALWFRMLVDAKLWEMSRQLPPPPATPARPGPEPSSTKLQANS
ncbi:glycosyltransferase family 2 protein [Variovorax sp.]|uniref:glycosyltransferase family 2 protein n=1 Tax=Variovorax sp. TaxID=1871043 RepID=UPI002D310DF2|nr:glycosyltransferase family 2 protein [Variovorax sp.]HYP84716.1 glycosyltransferase family 2 protein [Variovorax sp.]